MTMTVARFRREVVRRRGARRRGAPRYPEHLVAFAVEHVSRVRLAGGSLHAASAELGLSSMTVGSWLSRPAPRGRLREVVVTAPSPSAASPALTLTTPAGHVVNGLDVAQAAALLRALS